MEKITINLIDSNKQIPFILTYGLHKELQEFLLKEDRLLKIYSDTSISDEVIKICLSERNDMGQIIASFVELQLVYAEDILKLLDLVFEYFTSFFLKSNQKITQLNQSLNQISSPQ